MRLQGFSADVLVTLRLHKTPAMGLEPKVRSLNHFGKLLM